MMNKNTKADAELLRKALNLLDAKSEYATYCDKRFELNPFDEDAEDAFDRAYEAEYQAFTWAASIIVKLIGCDSKTAKTMIRTKRDRIDAILSMMA